MHASKKDIYYNHTQYQNTQQEREFHWNFNCANLLTGKSLDHCILFNGCLNQLVSKIQSLQLINSNKFVLFKLNVFFLSVEYTLPVLLTYFLESCSSLSSSVCNLSLSTNISFILSLYPSLRLSDSCTIVLNFCDCYNNENMWTGLQIENILLP